MRWLKEYRAIKGELEKVGLELAKIQENGGEWWNMGEKRRKCRKIRETEQVLECMAGDVERLEEKYFALTLDLINRTKSIEGAISGVEGVERQIIRARYFDGLEWAEIAEKLKVDIGTVYKWHERGLYGIYKVWYTEKEQQGKNHETILKSL